ncbi:MAG: hypothetical protein LBN06_11925 [Prevotellaceae bacterium]|jgi:hypothetical protein|nr:hypothetical protein [Prevotellaceae bacterium]
MKKFILLSCLLLTAIAAQAQFEKGKWMINPSLSGFQLGYDTGSEKTSLNIQGTGGWFVADNLALTGYIGAQFSGVDVLQIGAGARYYFHQTGFFAGADIGVYNADDNTDFTLGLEGGYAFFLSRTITVEPGVYWNIHSDASQFGVKVGFGFYF